MYRTPLVSAAELGSNLFMAENDAENVALSPREPEQGGFKGLSVYRQEKQPGLIVTDYNLVLDVSDGANNNSTLPPYFCRMV